MRRAKVVPPRGSEPRGSPGGALAIQPQRATSMKVMGSWRKKMNLRKRGRRESSGIDEYCECENNNGESDGGWCR